MYKASNFTKMNYWQNDCRNFVFSGYNTVSRIVKFTGGKYYIKSLYLAVN